MELTLGEATYSRVSLIRSTGLSWFSRCLLAFGGIIVEIPRRKIKLILAAVRIRISIRNLQLMPCHNSLHLLGKLLLKSIEGKGM